MSVPAQIEALLRTLTRADLDAMRPADRERFASALAHWAKAAAEARSKAGVLRDLKQGDRTP